MRADADGIADHVGGRFWPSGPDGIGLLSLQESYKHGPH